MTPLSLRRQRGATAVEFALVLLIMLTFILAIVDFSRMLYTWGAATEAARAGARYAVVCDDLGNKAQVLARMQALLPQIGDVDIAWQPAGCNVASCESLTLTITDLDYQWISPIAGLAKLAPQAMPTFATSLTREVMRQDPNSASICS